MAGQSVRIDSVASARPGQAPLLRPSAKTFAATESKPLLALSAATGNVRGATIFSYMSLVVVGSVAYDGVETPHGKVDRMLGGAATYIGLAASYFAPVKIVAVVGDDFAQEDVDLLASRQIDLEGLERVPGGKTFFWAGVYSADMNDRTTLRTDLNVFADFEPKLPDSYRTAPYLFLGNIQPDLQRSVRSQMNGVKLHRRRHHELLDQRFPRGPAGDAGAMGFPADQRQRSPPAFGRTQPAARGGQDHGDGPATLVIKRGEYGAILFHGDRHFMAPGYLLEDVFDPTGAGDCFAGGFMGYLAGSGVEPKDGDVRSWRYCAAP